MLLDVMDNSASSGNLYEQARQERILRNRQVLDSLGIQSISLPAPRHKPSIAKTSKAHAPTLPTRKSRRQQGEACDLTEEKAATSEAAHVSVIGCSLLYAAFKTMPQHSRITVACHR